MTTVMSDMIPTPVGELFIGTSVLHSSLRTRAPLTTHVDIQPDICNDAKRYQYSPDDGHLGPLPVRGQLSQGNCVDMYSALSHGCPNSVQDFTDVI